MDQVVQDSLIILIVQSEVFIPDQDGSKRFWKIRRAELAKFLKKITERAEVWTATKVEILKAIMDCFDD